VSTDEPRGGKASVTDEGLYRLTPGIRARKESFGVLFYNSKDGKLTFARSGDVFDVERNGDGTFLHADSLDGGREEKTRRFATALTAKGLLEPATGNIRRSDVGEETQLPSGTNGSSHDRTYGEVLRAPVNVTWEITARCNLHCRHCLSADVMGHSGVELDFDQCRLFIDELSRMGVFQVNFGGGEPFLRADFLDILDYAHAKGITTCVSTNGTVLTDSLVKRLVDMDLLYIQVSLDGASPETNDRIRGKGTFERIMKGIGLLVTHGFPHLSTNTVVTASNFRDITRLYELGAAHGIKTRLSRFRPSGNAKRMWGEYHLDKNTLAGLSRFLSAHKDVLTGDSFFSITAQDRRQLGLNMCGAAKMTCSVAPDGRVYPCAFLQDDLFLAGNVTRQSFQLIWQSAPPYAALRNLRIESCEDCGRFNICHGGCPAVAYFLTQSLNHPDPECSGGFRHFSSSKESNHGAAEYGRTV
jgi:mycofactocin radical SAM maturase